MQPRDVRPMKAQLCQVAMSVTDLRRTQRWYRRVLGLRPAGGTNTFRGPVLAMVQGLPGVASTCWWLLDAQRGFQLELFQFHRPVARTFDPPRAPHDLGYTMVSVHVPDFDAAVARARACGSPPLTASVGLSGERRICVRDPEGTLIELMEDDPRSVQARARARGGAALRSVRVSVADLERARRTFVDGLGCEEVHRYRLHGPEHEALWGLDAPKLDTLLLQAHDAFVEIVQYRDPLGAPRPADYRISDQGLLNVAFTFDGVREWARACRQVRQHGARANGIPLNFGVGGLTYLEDPQGLSIELLYLRPWLARRYGFAPRRSPVFAPFLRR